MKRVASPDFTRISTFERPLLFASASTLRIWRMLPTDLPPTSRMTSPDFRPCSAAAPSGSTLVTTSPLPPAPLPGKVSPVLHGIAVDGRDHVAGLQAGFRRRSVGLRFVDDRAFNVVHAQAVGDTLVHALHLHADPAALDKALVLERGHHGLDRVGRNTEADADRAAGRRVDRRVHGDHVAVSVEGRATGVALVDRRIDLDEVVV